MVASGKAVANSRRLWEQADRIRVLKGREESWRPFRTPELTACGPDVLRLATIFLPRCGRSEFSNSFLGICKAGLHEINE